MHTTKHCDHHQLFGIKVVMGSKARVQHCQPSKSGMRIIKVRSGTYMAAGAKKHLRVDMGMEKQGEGTHSYEGNSFQEVAGQ